VLQSEQRRIISAIQQDKQARLESGRLAVQQLHDESSFDGDSELGRRGSKLAVSSAVASVRDEISESDADLDKQLQQLKVASSGSTLRKIVIGCKFAQELRPPLRLVVSTASPSLAELKKALRKKTGRRYDILSLSSPGGLVKELVVEVQPGSEPSLSPLTFAVLDGLRVPVFVTDNAGVVLFGNDALCELVHGDVVDRHVAQLFKLTPPADKLDLISDLAGGTAAGTGSDGMLRSFQVSPVKIGKCTLHVWLASTLPPTLV
jgi:hypothetical protein